MSGFQAIEPASGGGGGSNTFGISNLGNTSGTTGVISGVSLQMALAGGNNVTLSQSVDGSSATITISIPNTAAQFTAGVTGGNTSQHSGTVASLLNLAGGNNVTLIGSTNAGSALSVTIQAGTTLHQWAPMPLIQGTTGQPGNGSMYFWPVWAPQNVTATRWVQMASISCSTDAGTTWSGSISLSAGIYSRTGSTLSLATSGSAEHTFSFSGSTGLASYTGLRQLSIAMNVNLTPGEWWLMHWSRSSTAGQNWFTASQIIISQMPGTIVGPFGAATNSSGQMMLGMGQYSNASTSGILPLASLEFSVIQGGTGQVGNKMPFVYLANTTA